MGRHRQHAARVAAEATCFSIVRVSYAFVLFRSLSRWARPECHGPHSIFSNRVAELILLRATFVFLYSIAMPWQPSMVKEIDIDGTHAIFLLPGGMARTTVQPRG